MPTVADRIHTCLAGRLPEDRLPTIEWAMWWWDQTIARWHGEGLPKNLDSAGLKRFFGLDIDHQFWFGSGANHVPQKQPGHGKPRIATMDEYRAAKPLLYGAKDPLDTVSLARCAAERDRGDACLWLTLMGFFWWPRELLGIEPHLYAFVDQPELLHAVNQDQADFILRRLDAYCAVAVPDFITIAEDMSYNNGPMISKAHFDDCIAPYYRQIIPAIHSRGIKVIIDSDGDVTRLLPWLESVGADGILPLERQAGVDIDVLQKKHPNQRFIGAYDKMVMPRGETAMRDEFERLLPVMRRGGFIPSVDHQTPPGVSLENYRIYLRLLKEYAVRACGG